MNAQPRPMFEGPSPKRTRKRMSFEGREQYVERTTVAPGEPDPYKFEILRLQKVECFWVSMIRYPNCANYEGAKILVTEYDPSTKKVLDPHFYQGSGLIARFVPTADGFEKAVKFAEVMYGS